MAERRRTTPRYGVCPIPRFSIHLLRRSDPDNDPAWANVKNGSGGTYWGLASAYYSQLSSVTGAFYFDVRLYYAQTGRNSLHWRYFTPDSGIVGGT